MSKVEDEVCDSCAEAFPPFKVMHMQIDYWRLREDETREYGDSIEGCDDEDCWECEKCTPICGIVFSVNGTVYSAFDLKPTEEHDIAEMNAIKAYADELNDKGEVNE